jgi:hypothetical protein
MAMAKVTVYKIQRIGGNRPQLMQSIGFVKESNRNDTDASTDKAESDSSITISYADWVASKDEEIGYWESLYPFWF